MTNLDIIKPFHSPADILANALSIKAPINGSFNASQIVQTITSVPSRIGSIPKAFVQNIEKIVDIKVKVMQPPQSPHI